VVGVTRDVAKRLAALCALAWALAIGVGAFGTGNATSGTGRLAVVATTPQVADLVRAVGGDRIRLTQLLAANADPHEHELRPSDVDALARARVAIRSGGEVDAWAADLEGPEPLALLDHAIRRGEDPHWWQDPRNALRTLVAIRDALTAADPAGRADYAAAAASATRRVRALDAAIERCWATVPRANRTLVSSHDSYGYYAARYGLRVLGSVIPSLSSEGQPSAGATDRLVRAIRRHRVRAVFAERGLSTRLERAIAKEGGATLGRPLQGDAPSKPYLEALAADTRTLVDGLAGRQVGCEL
jgi:ABC-type Zn uptake system ZnuABC Zn-binding protein ZnuA